MVTTYIIVSKIRMHVVHTWLIMTWKIIKNFMITFKKKEGQKYESYRRP